MKFKNKRVLITGGLGFIGSNLAAELVKLGAHVTIMDALIGGMGGNAFNIQKICDDVSLVISDVRDAGVENFKDVDIVFHLAGALSHVDSMKNPENDYALNVETTKALIDKLGDVEAVIFTGTRGQYGKINGVADETSVLAPIDNNGINKNIAEKLLLDFGRETNTRVSSLRFGNVYGPGHQMKHSRQGVINWFIRQALDGEKIKVYGGGQKRDCIFIDDAVNALLIVAGNEGVFNVSGDNRSLLDVVKVISSVTGAEFEITEPEGEWKNIEPGDCLLDSNKLKKLGWEVTTTIEEGLKKTVEYYKINKAQYW